MVAVPLEQAPVILNTSSVDDTLKHSLTLHITYTNDPLQLLLRNTQLSSDISSTHTHSNPWPGHKGGRGYQV